MKTTETIMQPVSKVVAFICDVCETEYRKDRDYEWIEVQEMVTISFTGGYGSIFGDMQKFELDICQHCMKMQLGKYFRKVQDYLHPTQEELQAGSIISQFDWKLEAGSWEPEEQIVWAGAREAALRDEIMLDQAEREGLLDPPDE